MIGERIKEARKRAGMTQKELGAAVGVAEITIRHYENDRNHPPLQMIEKIAAALNVRPAQLAGWSDTNKDDLDYLARILRGNDDNIALALEQLQVALDHVDDAVSLVVSCCNKAFNELSFELYTVRKESDDAEG